MVLEAWSARCPVIAAASQGPTELITQDRDGLLVDNDSPEALGRGIQTLLDDPDRAKRLADNGRDRYETGFAEAPVVARWRDFLATVEKA